MEKPKRIVFTMSPGIHEKLQAIKDFDRRKIQGEIECLIDKRYSEMIQEKAKNIL